MILMIDHYDSFVHSLARYVRLCGYDLQIERCDKLDTAQALALKPEAIILSPGPGHPIESGVSCELVRQADIPILGVCLGHQIIAHSFGGEIHRHSPSHGEASEIHHNGHDLFAELPSPFAAARYHSLIAAHLPECLEAIAWTETCEIMAVQHTQKPIYGLQFHPESVLTLHGQKIVNNFLAQNIGARS